jgi:type IV pilus assembly protein PilB
MVGEIRDRETMDTAIESSLTGHLVFSTIHTNSAVETLTRIGNMGVPPFLMAATVNLIIAQRLVRKICAKCKQEAATPQDLMDRVKRALKFLHPDEVRNIDPNFLIQGLKFYEGKGCEECSGSGYHGRLGIFEVMLMNNRLRRLILDQAPTMEIEKAALESGMVGLEQAGILKALKGETTLEEVYSVARESEVEEAAAVAEQKTAAPVAAPVSAVALAPAPAPVLQAAPQVTAQTPPPTPNGQKAQ